MGTVVGTCMPDIDTDMQIDRRTLIPTHRRLYGNLFHSN